MNTSSRTEFYLSFTALPPYPTYFQLLSDKAAFDLCLEGGKALQFQTTRIFIDSAREGDPRLFIIVISDVPITREDATAITQAAIDWLHKNGHWTFPVKRS